MSWGKVENRFGRELENIRKQVKVYDYSWKHCIQTDEGIRGLLSKHLRSCRDRLLNILELAVKEKDKATSNIKSVKDEVDLAISSVNKSQYGKFPEASEQLEEIVKRDIVLVDSAENLNSALKNLYDRISKSNANEIEAELQSIKVDVINFKSMFKEREDLIKG